MHPLAHDDHILVQFPMQEHLCATRLRCQLLRSLEANRRSSFRLVSSSPCFCVMSWNLTVRQRDRCEKWLRSCDDALNPIDCDAAFSFCSLSMVTSFDETGTKFAFDLRIDANKPQG